MSLLHLLSPQRLSLSLSHALTEEFFFAESPFRRKLQHRRPKRRLSFSLEDWKKSFSSPESSTARSYNVRLQQEIVTMGGLPAQSTASVISLSVPRKDQGSGNVASGPDSKPKKKICCACPETKKLRDECIVENGEAACEKWIEAHRKCLRAEGFKV